MHLIARFPNVVDDFGKPVYLQTNRIGIDDVAYVPLLKVAANHTRVANTINEYSFPSAILPQSVLDKDATRDAKLVSGISEVEADSLYTNEADFKKHYQVVSYKSQQGAMVVDHWVRYDGFMVVEMGEVKTRW
jgi:hypothetical protein